MIKVSIPAQPSKDLKPNIVVIGVGGAGGNAVDNMITSDLEGVNFVVCNTDAQALSKSLCDERVQLGADLTQGLGAGSDPQTGASAAEESIEDVSRYLDGMNMAFITCGMGGGTGTGAAPVIARAAKERGLLTVGVVTKPFQFEGAHRMRLAEAGIEEMQQYVDTLIIIPNQNLFRIANENTTFAEAFKMADGVLQSGVRGVTDLMIKPGMINLDFADVRCTMSEMGKAMMGTGEASGDNRAIEAAESAINNPLLDDVSMKGARGVIINITGGYDMTLMEVNDVCNRIRDEIDDEANIIFGSTFDDRLDGVIRVSVVATGIESDEIRKSKPLRPAAMNTQAGGRPLSSARQAAPLADSMTNNHNNGGSETSYSSQGSGAGTGRMPTSLPASSVDMGEEQSQKVVGSDISYASGSNTATQSFNTSQTAQSGNAQPSQISMGRTESLSGQRVGSSFIPPRAVQPSEIQAQAQTATQPQQNQATPQNSPFGFNSYQSSQQKTQSTATQTGPQAQGLVLNPPKLPTPGEKAQKAPSLFERMSGMVKQITGQNGDDEFEASLSGRAQQQTSSQTATEQKPQPQNQTTYTPSINNAQPMSNQPQQSHQGQHVQANQHQDMPAAPQLGGYPPVQGQLDVTVPQPDAPKRISDVDLEIPAFLRRQAN